MQVTETLSDGLKRELQVTVTADDLSNRLDQKLNEIKDQVQLKGFRPGKVPVSHLRQRFGRQMMTEIIQEVVTDSSQKALEEREMRPAMQPSIDIEGEVEPIVEGDADLVYKLTFELLPEFELGDLSSIEVEKPVAEVDEKEVEDMLNRFAEQQQNFESRGEGEAAQDGDQIVLDFVGKLDGEPFEGGAAEDANLVIGSNRFIPGFEEQLVGVKAGDETTITVTFPQEYGAEHLAGKEATFDVMVKDVQAPAETAIDDEFAKSLGMDDLEALRGAIREQIQGNYASLARNKMKRSMLDALDDIHDFQLPPMMVEHEFNQIWGQLEHQLQHQNKTLADLDEPEDTVRAEYQKIAERRVRLGLVLARIGEENEITVGNDELNRALMQRAQQFPGQERQVYEFYQNNPNAIAELRAPIFEDKVIDYITELAKVTEKPVTVEELMASDDEDEGLPFIPEHDHDHDHGDHDHGDHDHAHEEGEETKA